MNLTHHYLKPERLSQNLLLQSLQIVRITALDQTGLLINQSAVVDQQNDVVTFSVTSSADQASTVLFDVKHVGPDVLHKIVFWTLLHSPLTVMNKQQVMMEKKKLLWCCRV